jgi:hypothetical protein
VDIQKELAAEYRKAAEAALASGDHRRAAFIYGKLLRDYRQAARVLAQGGLHRDAAIIYLTRCADKRSAAAEFAAAGETDRAVQLYREEREHLLAGDLLRSTGDDEAAVGEFQKAAEAFARSENWQQGAKILVERARRSDLAIALLETGWSRRAKRPAIGCAVDLASLYVQEKKTDRLLALVSEAEVLVQEPGRQAEASLFFGTLTRLSEHEAVEPGLAHELRDRARLGLALKLAQRARWDPQPARVVSEVFGTHAHFSAGVLADARLAVAASQRKRKASSVRDGISRHRVATGAVTAVACAPGAGVIFLGLASGEIHRFSVADRQADRLTVRHALVRALATDSSGQYVVAVRGSETAVEVVSYSRRLEGPYFQIASIGPVPSEAYVLSNVAEKNGRVRVAVADGSTLGELDVPALAPQTTPSPAERTELAALILDSGRVLAFGGSRIFCGSGPMRYLGWTPEVPGGSPLLAAPLSWLPAGEERLEVAGLSESGVVAWTSLPPPRSGERPAVIFRSAGYRAVALVKPGVLAAVSKAGIEWLEVSQANVVQIAVTAAVAANAVACFHVEPTQELVVVLADGTVLCVP